MKILNISLIGKYKRSECCFKVTDRSKMVTRIDSKNDHFVRISMFYFRIIDIFHYLKTNKL